MSKKPLLIYNPIAGHGKARKKLPFIEKKFAQYQFSLELVLTQYPGHAEEIARQEAENKRGVILAAGGDGTMNEVINGIMTAGIPAEERPVMGVLPVGRGNDFAFGLNITNNLEQAISIIVGNRTQKVDIGSVVGGDYPQGRFFGNGIGLGFDTMVGFEAAKIKWAKGMSSYLIGLFRTIKLYHQAPIYQVELDDESFTGPCLQISIMNGRRMGGAFLMTPDSDPCDGTFNLCIGNGIEQKRILALALKFLNGSHVHDPAIQMTQSRKVTVKAVTGGIPAHADGETICECGTEVTAIVIHKALTVIMGKENIRYEKKL